jgi:hypothetical protein
VVAAGSVQDGLTVVLNLPWPTGTLVQVCLWTSPVIEPLLAEYQRLRLGQTAPLLQQAVTAQVDFFRAGVDRPLEPRSGVQVRDLVLIVTVKLPLAGQAPNERERQLAETLRVSAGQCLNTGGLLPRPLDAEALLRVLGSLLNTAPTAT